RALGATELTELEQANAPTVSDLEARSPTEQEQKANEQSWVDWFVGKKGAKELTKDGSPKAKVLRLNVVVNGNEAAVAAAGGGVFFEPPGLKSLTATETFI